MAESAPGIKTLAWNGLSMAIPQSWEAGALGRTTVRLDDDQGVAMEIKWQQITGYFSFPKHLKRVAKSYKKLQFAPCDLPEAWDEALDSYERRGFSFEGAGFGGMGAILHDPLNHVAAVMQVYRRGRDIPKKHVVEASKTFRFHHAGTHIPWAIYDIRAVVPSRFSLIGFTLNPGYYRFDLGCPGETLGLARFAPAEIVLAGQPLSQWTAGKFDKMIQRYQLVCREQMTDDVESAVDWEQHHQPSSRASLAARLTGRRIFGQARTWLAPESNRILSVDRESKRFIDQDEFNDVCDNFETL